MKYSYSLRPQDEQLKYSHSHFNKLTLAQINKRTQHSKAEVPQPLGHSYGPVRALVHIPAAWKKTQ